MHAASAAYLRANNLYKPKGEKKLYIYSEQIQEKRVGGIMLVPYINIMNVGIKKKKEKTQIMAKQQVS